MDKRQWHTNVWSIAGPDSTTSETATSAAGGKTVVVTKIVSGVRISVKGWVKKLMLGVDCGYRWERQR